MFFLPLAAPDPPIPLVPNHPVPAPPRRFFRPTDEDRLIARIVTFALVVTVGIVLSLTIALVVTTETDNALYQVILFTNCLSLLSLVYLHFTPDRDWFIRVTLLAAVLYLGSAIAFSVKLGRPHDCYNINYISSNTLISGSILRCKLAKAVVVFLWFGALPFASRSNQTSLWLAKFHLKLLMISGRLDCRGLSNSPAQGKRSSSLT